MNLLKTLSLTTLVCAALALADPPKFAEPILVTSCGQSADGMSAKLLLQRDSLRFDYLPQATAGQVADHGSVILVVGGSSKGLGAAKISAEDETARVTALLTAAQAAKLPVLALHLGGPSRRGSLSDQFNQLGAANAQLIIVIKGGDDDGFFAKIAAEKEIPLQTVEKLIDLGPVLKQLYSSGE
ncbi:hypothetical protein HZB60_07885 [candidate division KSB1 bacterium]|nr:hypothetical protein [candidate division KSB1 bacterium]